MFFKQEDEGRGKCKKKNFHKILSFCEQEFISWHKCTHETWRQPSSFIWDIFFLFFVILSLLSTINLLLLFIGVAMVPSSSTWWQISSVKPNLCARTGKMVDINKPFVISFFNQNHTNILRYFFFIFFFGWLRIERGRFGGEGGKGILHIYIYIKFSMRGKCGILYVGI